MSSAKPFKAKHGLDANNQDITDVNDLEFSTGNTLNNILMPENQVIDNPNFRVYSGSKKLVDGSVGHDVIIPLAQGESIYLIGHLTSADNGPNLRAGEVNGIAINDGGSISFYVTTSSTTTLIGKVLRAGDKGSFGFNLSHAFTDNGDDTFSITFDNTLSIPTVYTWYLVATVAAP